MKSVLRFYSSVLSKAETERRPNWSVQVGHREREHRLHDTNLLQLDDTGYDTRGHRFKL